MGSCTLSTQSRSHLIGTCILLSMVFASVPVHIAGPSTTQATCTWNAVTSPNTALPFNVLYDVAVVASNDIWAVGKAYSTSPSTSQALIEHWNGIRWTIISGAPITGSLVSLTGVAAISSTDVWAVGTMTNPSNGISKTLTEHWNGQQWTIVPSPNRNKIGSQSANNVLGSVAAIASNDVWAVGYYRTTTLTLGKTLVEHWNGTNWTIVTSPNPGSFDNELYGVTAISSTDVWAVGEKESGGTEHNMVQHWDGASWTVIPSPPFPKTNVDLMYRVSAVSATDIWAVGYFTIPNPEGSPLQTATIHWDGTSWSIVASPNPSPSFDVLYAVAAIASNDVWAVGGFQQGSRTATLTEHWNGTSWTVVSSPSPGSGIDELLGVAAVSSTDVWSVGEQANLQATLVEQCQ